LSTFVVTAEQAKTRLDALVRELGSLSQKKAKLLCALGGIFVDGACAAGTARVREGAEVSFQAEHLDLMLKLGLPVAYADDDVLVLQKPPGLAVLAVPQGDPSLADALDREMPGCEFVHRLDRDASGLLLVARHADALMHLDIAMARAEIQRTFEAIVSGSVTEDEQTVSLPVVLAPDADSDDDDDEEQPSPARLTVLGRREGATHLSISTETGHSHQIRAHLQKMGHPILGDARYGDPQANDHARATFGVHRALLHSKRIQFAHPSSAEAIDVTASNEPDFGRLFPQRRPR
jgi:RluA family pseudouridine synthase